MLNENSRLLPSNGSGRSTIEENLEGGESFRRYDSDRRNSCCSDCTKSFVFGGFDGIVSSLSIISGAAGGQLSWRVVLILGLSSIVANALSLGISEFLSSKAHREFLQAEKRRELWEFKNYKEGEMQEMVNRFEARGMEKKDAELVVSKMAQYESFFVGLMVTEELGLQLPEEDDVMLFTDALVMCLSFGIFGFIPLAIICLIPFEVASERNIFLLAIGFALFILCIFAAIKSSFSSATAIHSTIEALCLGVVCSFLSYVVGATVMDLIT